VRATSAEPIGCQCRHQPGEAVANPGDAIAQARERGAEREHGAGAEPLRHAGGGNLQARHGAAEERAQETDGRIAQAELGLPDRQRHPDEVGVAVVQDVRARRDAERAPLGLLGAGLLGRTGRIGRCGDRHVHAFSFGRRSTKTTLTKENTSSPA
jgi:hypothetical protein